MRALKIELQDVHDTAQRREEELVQLRGTKDVNEVNYEAQLAQMRMAGALSVLVRIIVDADSADAEEFTFRTGGHRPDINCKY